MGMDTEREEGLICLVWRGTTFVIVSGVRQPFIPEEVLFVIVVCRTLLVTLRLNLLHH